MNDLVTRLRAFDCITMEGCGDDLRKEAADRIEELEAALQSAEQAVYANAMEAERKLHENRIEQLEAALRDIADGMGEKSLTEIGRYAPVIARKALAQIPERDDE